MTDTNKTAQLLLNFGLRPGERLRAISWSGRPRGVLPARGHTLYGARPQRGRLARRSRVPRSRLARSQRGSAEST